MKKSTATLLTLVAMLAPAIHPLRAAVPATAVQHTPGQINYQGRLVNAAGADYVDGVYTFDIRLFRKATGGTPVWGGTYSTYVKGGYFNIMLGGATGANLAGTTYTNAEIWKALWPDPATSAAEKNALFLGLTPWHDEDNAQIAQANRVELSPRQSLLTAPYAFRAQTAEYANQSISNFVVNGAFSASHATGGAPILKTRLADSAVPVLELGIGVEALNRVSITSSNVLIGAQTMVATTSGTMLLASAGTMTLYSNTDASITANNTLTLGGTGGTTVGSGSSTLNLTGSKVRGKNAFEWLEPDTASTYAKPFSVTTHNVTIPVNARYAWFETSIRIDRFAAMMVGFHAIGDHDARVSALAAAQVRTVDGESMWYIYLERDKAENASQGYSVHVLSINKHLATDNR